MVDRAAKELELLLRTDAQAMRNQEREVYVRLARERAGDIVLVGAGGLGRKVAAGLRANDVEPIAFVDNDPARQGTVVDGLQVLAPAAAAEQFRNDAVFIVTIWGANSSHRFAQTRDQLGALGCAVMVFPPICWRFAEELLPHYLHDLPHKLLEQKADVRRAYDLWHDDASRDEYVSQVRFRLTADFDGLAHPVKHPQYFPDDIYEWRDDEWIVDGGAYDGDSIRSLVALHGERFGHVLALEPDPVNFVRLQSTVAAMGSPARSRVDARQVALGAERGQLLIDVTGTASSATRAASAGDDHSAVVVDAVPLDELLGAAVPTMIKLDIEGAEPDALAGARATIRAHAPVIAVCVYHRQNHLWRLPLMLRDMRDDYAYFLRPHNEEGWDLVCYAVPRSRLSRAVGR